MCIAVVVNTAWRGNELVELVVKHDRRLSNVCSLDQSWGEVAGPRPAVVPRWSRESGLSAGIRGQRR